MGWMHSKCTSRHGGCTSSTSAFESIDCFWAEKIRLHWFKLWGSVVVIGVRLLAVDMRTWWRWGHTHNPTLPPNKFNGSANVVPLIPCHVEWGHPFRWKGGQHFWTLAATFDIGHVRISLSLQLCKSANSVNVLYYLAKWSRAFVESYNTPRQPDLPRAGITPERSKKTDGGNKLDATWSTCDTHIDFIDPHRHKMCCPFQVDVHFVRL